MKIEGSVAVVTGANRGIGRALVEALLSRGAARVYAGARQLNALEGLQERSAGRVVPIRLDVTDSEQIDAAATLASDATLLINNAGVAAHAGGPLTDAAWLSAGRREMDVNVFGALAVTQAFAPTLARNGGGTIVNLNSVASFVGFPMLASYSFSKAASHSLTQITRAMLANQNTRVVGVYPGPVDTDMAADIPMEKTPASVVAARILDGVEQGEEEIFPDPMSQQMGEVFLRDPKGLERQLATPA